MYKFSIAFPCKRDSRILSKFLLIMKLTFVLLMAALLHVSAATYSQNISLKVKDVSLLDVFKQLHRQSGVEFVYDNKMLKEAKSVSINAVNEPLIKVLDECFLQQPLSYEIIQNMIVIKRKTVSADVVTQNRQPVITVVGKVVDEKGLAMPGVTIKLKDGSVSTSTRLDGTYTIKLPNGDGILVFSFIGYATQEIPVNNTNEINITLKESGKTLNDVVIVGYGQQKKISVIGAISTVKVEDLKQPVANLTDVIAGRIAGVIGVQRSGQPGHDNADIYIRGISTFTGAGPLVLVDGVERDFANVDPEDIANFSILKDASATAVYGVRGANGVILIQTKKGKIGKPLINAQYDQGITQFTKIPKLADGVTYMQMANEAYLNSNPGKTPIYSQDRIDKTASGADPDLDPNVDWFKVLFNKFGQNRRARVNANGGSENAQYYLSVGYYDEKGLLKTDQLANYNSAIKFSRYNFTSNLTLNVTKTTKVEFGASGFISNGNYPGTSITDIWNAAYVLPPILIPPVYSNGYNSQIRTGDIHNPYNLLTQSGYITEFQSQLWSNIRITQDLGRIVKGLSATAMFSFDDNNSHTVKRTKTPTTYLASGRDAQGNLVFETQPTQIGTGYLGYDNGTNGATRQYYDEVALNYNRSFSKNNVTGLVLFNQQDKETPFATDFISAIPYRYMGFAGRVTYAYDSKYLGEANFGYNGSETFAPGHRFGFFPAFGAGWVISKEKFFEPFADAVSLLKLRYSYGVVGNSNIGGRRFAYISTVGGGNGNYSYGQNGTNQTINGYDIGDYAVNVTWEKAKKQNLGIELGLFNSAVSLTVDAFQENRTGIFRQRGDVPPYVGLLSLPYANLGEIHNRGIDASLEINKRLGRDWQLGLKGNFTFNKAIDINDANAPWPYPWQQRIGQPYGKRFGYTALGLFKSDADVANSPYQTGINKAGDIKYKDLNGDGKIDSYDQGPIGYGSIPSIVYGFGPTINYRGFALSGWFKGISSVDISLNGDGLQPFSQGGERGNLLAEITDRWTPTNPNPHPLYPRLTYGNQNMNYEPSTWWEKNGAFMRLQTLELSYDFAGAKWLPATGISNLSIYFIGYNLWTLSGFKLWDVELGDGNGAQYPLTKTYNLGLKCTFK